jgi:DNA polymerase III epsilon subunit-like protein
MLDFTAIDFETANSYRGSPCAVGLIRYRNGQPVDERRWLIRPPEQVDYFDPFNTALHGINAETVKDAPRWNLVLPAIVDYIGDDIVVAHNAGFDIGVIRYACAVDNIDWPEMQFLCTLVLARRAKRLPSYRLPFVTDACGFEMTDHHDPLADARAVGGIVSALAREGGVSDLPALAAAHHICIGHMSSGIYKGSVSTLSGAGRLVRPDLNPDADPDGYLYGRVVVFTGGLMSMTRQIAWEECARAGAVPDKTPTKRTNVLVVGDINPAVLRPGSNITGKARRAFELQDKGQDIEVMTEDDFLRCLEGKPLDDITDLAHDAAPAPSTTSGKPNPLRRVPRDQRPEPAQPKEPTPPRPLRRDRVPTDQVCSVDDCENIAAFKTRSKPTYCDDHITAILRSAGLDALESFTRPDDWLLTRCLSCGNVAHYRFVYVLDKNGWGEPTCRACYWRAWAIDQRGLLGPNGPSHNEPVPYEKAQAIAEANGFFYLGTLTSPSLLDDPHRTECRRCGKISAARLGDIAFGCTCQPLK